MSQICPRFLSSGSCQVEWCGFRHDVTSCEPCQLLLDSPAAYAAHLYTKKHTNKVSGKSALYHCPACDVTLNGTQTWGTHIQGKRHIARARAATEAAAATGTRPNVGPARLPVLQGQRRCELCDLIVSTDSWAWHITQRGHRSKEDYVSSKRAVEDASRDRNGVVISHGEGGLDFGVVEASDAWNGVSLAITVKTTAPTSQIKLVRLKLSSSASQFPSSVCFSIGPDPLLPLQLQFGREARVTVILRQSALGPGRFEDRLEMTFEDAALGERFVVIRRMKATVGSQADYDLLKPSRPYIARPRSQRQAETDIVPGPPAPALGTIKWSAPLPQAFIPKTITSALFAGSVSDIIGELRQSVLPAVLNAETHARHFKSLIWIEENRMEHDLQIYDIDDAQLTKYNQYYYLPVPGLAEKRPSVLTGDLILVQRRGAESGRWFEGHVHVLRQQEVGLRFHGSFPPPVNRELHNIRFKLNRIPLRRQHQALDGGFIESRVLFPQQRHVEAMTPLTVSITHYNERISGNGPQSDAVRAVASRPPGSVPFVIFGPPGTGKTVTTIEAIRQVLHLNRNARVLACAPSNSAADLLASRLAMVGRDQLFRHYAPSRVKDTVPDELRSFTYINDSGYFALPPVMVLRRFRVIVTTCVSASFAHGVGIPRGHFTHIFIDEAGQATEPEAMIAIKTMADARTNVILSGDPKQLGPIIRSGVARRMQLDISYLERLMRSDVYDEYDGHGVTVVKLTKNYRSHPSILKYPNERFYNNELEPCGEHSLINSFVNSPLLVSPKFPVVFHGMSGKDTREASSPSFFNIEEALQVKAYVEALRSDRKFRCTDSDIGVVAPYHAQCVKLRTLLRPIAEGIKVGSTEEFQGQERRVMIISTVRSSREFVEYDLRHTLGFVANPRRFNVAITRAQALLIVVGDPNVLSLDPLWRSFLNYVYLSGGWRGMPISWDPDAPVREEGGYDAEFRARGRQDMYDFAARMEALTLSGLASTGGLDDVDETDANIDRPWREVE
ncbi:P-loop containing nucleoside triphosphate hydrolase protein [Artomyces pyxidatus]|uniref:P-loop containing nucleoside triphosphate hydrolase protein n=1 Tax=Artomyces pyxidatus TaxID=48021 RepID=A0ACB8T1T3_9AGAM|nr:P-loop containing nucleoside triphosphate hydrolase protein [Artomyces pyxidatus]